MNIMNAVFIIKLKQKRHQNKLQIEFDWMVQYREKLIKITKMIVFIWNSGFEIKQKKKTRKQWIENENEAYRKTITCFHAFMHDCVVIHVIHHVHRHLKYRLFLARIIFLFRFVYFVLRMCLLIYQKSFFL